MWCGVLTLHKLSSQYGHRGWKQKRPQGARTLRSHGESFGPSQAMVSGTFEASLQADTNPNKEASSRLRWGLLFPCLPPPTLSAPHQQPAGAAEMQRGLGIYIYEVQVCFKPSSSFLLHLQQNPEFSSWPF